jgi:hypothetical protein
MYVGHHYAPTHIINENKKCALQQTTGKTGIKHSLCDIDVNITNRVIFFTHHEQYYIDIHCTCANLTFAVLMAYTISMHIITT